MPARPMLHEVDPRQDLLDKIGSLDGLELFNNQVLCAIYVAPAKFASGLFRPDSNRDEDKIQSKVGLVLMRGPQAFVDTEKWVFDTKIELGDWIFFRVSDGWNTTINGVPCRILDDVNIRGRITDPDQIW